MSCVRFNSRLTLAKSCPVPAGLVLCGEMIQQLPPSLRRTGRRAVPHAPFELGDYRAVGYYFLELRQDTAGSASSADIRQRRQPRPGLRVTSADRPRSSP